MLKTHIICTTNSIKILPRSVNKKNRFVGNLFYNVQKYRDGFGITRAVLFYFHRISLVKEQFVILSKTGSLYRQPNLFRLFLSTSSVLEHELKTHISDVLKNSLFVIGANRLFSYLQKIFSILQQITPCRTDMVRKEGYILFTSYRKGV